MSIGNDGSAMWLSPLVVESVCHFNVRFFPYDTQFCHLDIGSWLYHGFEIDLWNRNPYGSYETALPSFLSLSLWYNNFSGRGRMFV